jgi:Tfp pilus assembly protein PilE
MVLTGTEVTGDIVAAKSWLQKHERLIIVVLVLGLLTFATQKTFDVIANRDKQQAAVAAQTLAAQVQKDQQLSQAVAASTAQYQALVTSLSQQNSQLINSVQARNSVLNTQQTTDKVLTQPQLATRWLTLISQQAGVLDNGQTIEVTHDAALDTVLQLEQVPVLTANLNDGKVVLQNTQDELASANQVIVIQKADIDGLNQQLTDQKKADTIEIESVKAQARKSKLKWFGAGLVVGFIGGKVW